MDKQLRLLDSFPARGADGAAYKVMAYEHLRRVDLMSSGAEQWEPTGQTEYRLASGERVPPGHCSPRVSSKPMKSPRRSCG